MALFLVSMRDGDSDLLLGACQAERDVARLIARHAADVYLRSNGCKCCGRIHPKDEADNARIEREMNELAVKLLGQTRLERVG